MKKIHHKVKHHHVFIIIFLGISILFAGNILAVNQVYKLVKRSDTNSKDNQIILSRYDENSLNDDALAPLADKITDVLLAYDIPIAVGVKNLTNGEAFGLNDKVTYQSASFYKLFVGYEILRQVDEGKLSLNMPVYMKTEESNIKDCFEIMIKVSDNDCGRALRKIISADKKPLEDLAEAGFVGTNLMNDYPVTSVSDVVLLFDKLYNNTDLEADTNNLFLDSLALQEINNRLPLGLPETAQILHKTADLEGYSHDGGIIYATFGDFIVVIMSGPWPDGVYDSPPVFIEIMRTIYDELSSLSSS